MHISGSETQSPSNKVISPAETQSVKCDSCGFTEECTPAYILRVRERHQGRWICGLCIEAVKDEVHRSDTAISTAEALNRHINFCEEFRTSFPPAKTEHPIIAISKVLRRRRNSFQVHHSNSSTSLPTVEGVTTPTLLRSGSCFPALSR
ncbi:hypothetical protein SLEP1_g34304 [Rubroshorea leprosula]|uniref:DUF1677 family protein n=1 Tax=Rubroshorea leprosula TaxID=152421 RepID=A0AAV5KJL5_9ROSI|nr:hypothetical protein SLEP1_g34304 [Rubroshorea leprosula]